MKRWLLLAIAALATVFFASLAIWQIERRAWKLALIERVEARVHAAPVAAPGPSEWPRLTKESAEYRRVTATGRFLESRSTLVQAVTDLGAGFWLMTPMRTDQGFTVLVNRGFVPQGWRIRGSGGPNVIDSTSATGAGEEQSPGNVTSTAGVGNAASAASAGRAPPSPTEHDGAAQPGTTAPIEATASITGLLRISEPKGAFLRANAPAENRWYSRDVPAIAKFQHLTNVAPYFVDAEASAPGAPGGGSHIAPEDAHEAAPDTLDNRTRPVAGLTVVQFRNSHLQYAITWFLLALMALALGVRVARTR